MIRVRRDAGMQREPGDLVDPVLETPALEVFLELLLHIPRQLCALRREVRLECGTLFLDGF